MQFFLYKRINILDTRLLWGNYLFEKFMIDAFWYVFEVILNKKWLFSCRNTTNYSCTHMLGSSGAYSRSPEKILKMCCSLVCCEVYFDQIVY